MDIKDVISLALNCYREGLDTKEQATEKVVGFVYRNYQPNQSEQVIKELNALNISRAVEMHNAGVYFSCNDGQVLYAGAEGALPFAI